MVFYRQANYVQLDSNQLLCDQLFGSAAAAASIKYFLDELLQWPIAML